MKRTIKHEPSCGEDEGSTHWGCPCQMKLVRDLEAQVRDLKAAANLLLDGLEDDGSSLAVSRLAMANLRKLAGDAK